MENLNRLKLEDAIAHLEETIERLQAEKCDDCARDHKQLKGWLEELRNKRTLCERLKAERDAAVRDIVEAMEADLSMRELTHQCWFCAFYNSDDCPLEKDGECAPKWRGPQQEET